MMADFPESYKDPLYASLDTANERKYALPVGMLSSVRDMGERTDASKTSSAGASTPYQFIPATRKAVLDKYGIDVALSPENASEGAALLLQESLKRNSGDPERAIREYHGGVDPANWGKQNDAYWTRVAVGMQKAKTGALENDFSKWMAANPAIPTAGTTAPTPASTSAAAPATNNPMAQGFAQFLKTQSGSQVDQIPLPDGANPAITPQADPSLVDTIIGTGEAGLNVLSGATTGMVGLAGGAVKGLAGSIIDGTIGTQQGVRQVENAAAAGADALTYAPRTQSGQDQAHAVGEVVQNLVPVAPLTAEMAALSRGVKPAVQAAVDKTAAVVDRGAPPAAAAAPAPAPTATPAAPATAAFTVPDFVTNPAKSSMDKANRMTSDLLADPNIPAEVKTELQGAAANGLMKPENKAYVAAVAAARKEGNLTPERVDSIYQTMVEPAAAPEAVATNAPAAAPDQATAAPSAAPAAIPLPPDQLAATTRTAAIGGFGSKKATATLAAQAAPDAATVAAADRLGVLDHLQPDHYTTNQAYRQIAQLVKSQTGSPAAMAQREGLLKVAESADNLITQIGGTSDLSSLSTNAAARMKATNLELKAQAKKLYDEVDNTIGLASPAPAPNIIALIKTNAKNLGGEENLPAVERGLLKQLSPKEDGAQPTYALLDKLRKDIGEAKRGKQNQFGSSNEHELIQLENALRADQKAIADAAGMGERWELAQATSKAYKGVQNDLKAIYGKELDKSMAPLLTGAIKDLGTGNTSRFIKLLKSTPDDMRQEVTASGLASFFQRTSRGGEMDFAGYARWYDGLQRNKQAYAALMSNLPPAARQQLADLALVARGAAMSKGEFIATGKAINPKALEAADSLMGRVFDEVRRRGVTGLVAEAVGSASGAPGLASALQSATTRNKPTVMAMADKLITSPEFIAAVKAADTKAAPAAARSLAYSKAFTKFIRALGAPRELRDREKWISQAMQAEATQSQNNQQRK